MDIQQRNPEQIAAADPAQSAWVSAHAGSGKTFILIDRVVRLLLADVAPEHILCLTFTNAAAAEMSERLYKKLGEWAICSQENLKEELCALEGTPPDAERLARARVLFARILEVQHGLRIQTIHAFCQSVLKRFPVEAGISPSFQVVDEYSTRNLLKEAQAHMLGAADKERNAMKIIADNMESTVFEIIFSEIINQRKNVEAALQNYPEKIKRLAKKWGVDQKIDSKTLRKKIIHEQPVERLREAAAAMIEHGTPSFQDRGEKLLAIFNAGKNIDFIEEYLNIFLTEEKQPRKKLSSKNIHQSIENILRQEQERIITLIQKINKTQSLELTNAIAQLANGFLETFTQLKARKNLLDYDDLIAKTLALFKTRAAGEWVLYRLDGGLRHILIDEAQDTNPEQWQLITSLTEEFFAGLGAHEDDPRSFFAVGDAKQSIFSFQGAAPEGFAKKQQFFSQKAAVVEKKWKNISLTRSFRALPELLKLVDQVFSALPLDPESNEVIEHISHRGKETDAAGYVEIWPPFEKDDDRLDDIKLAKTIAIKIAALVKTGKHSMGDFLILLRRRTPFIKELIEALRKQGLAVAGLDRLKLENHPAIMDLMSLAKFVLLPEDDLSLAEILKSPLCNLSEDDLMRLALNRKQSLWESLCTQKEGFSEAHRFLSESLQRADFISVFEFFSEVLETKNMRSHFVKRIGEDVHDVLDEFLNLILIYEKSSTPSLQNFVEWASSAQAEIKRDMNRDQDKIRIMTIHSAKGLEAKIVFLVDVPPHTPSHYWQPVKTEKGAAPFWSISRLPISEIDTLKKENKNYEKYEENRLLYVAMTRAQDALYICGYHKKKSGSDLKWLPIIAAHMDKTPPPEKAEDKIALQPQQTKPITAWVEKEIATPKDEIRTINPSMLSPAAAPSQRVASPLREKPLSQPALLGTMMHEALRHPEMPPEKLTALLQKKFADHPECAALALAAHQLIGHETLGALFLEGLTEVPVQAIFGAAPKRTVISGQIDRLILDARAQTAQIIDFKTDAQPPENADAIPPAYQKQLAAYQMVIAAAYPDWQVSAAILWTRIPRLDPLRQNLLDNHVKMIISEIDNKGDVS